MHRRLIGPSFRSRAGPRRRRRTISELPWPLSSSLIRLVILEALAMNSVRSRALVVSHRSVDSEAAIRLTTSTFDAIKSRPEHRPRRGAAPRHARRHERRLGSAQRVSGILRAILGRGRGSGAVSDALGDPPRSRERSESRNGDPERWWDAIPESNASSWCSESRELCDVVQVGATIEKTHGRASQPARHRVETSGAGTVPQTRGKTR